MKIGLIGNGFVGQATQLLANSDVDFFVYDIVPEKCIPVGLKFTDLSDCDIIFVCLPTPMCSDGSCSLKLVNKVITELKQIVSNTVDIVLRSTVIPGTSDNLGVYFMPEFHTEKNWQEDFYLCSDWIVGSNGNTDFETKMTHLINNAYRHGKIKHNTLHFISTKQAEMVKYIRNCFLATKVAFFNEIEEYCRTADIEYNTVKNLAAIDYRIGISHTKVPNDGKRGFGGTCFPKDMHALHHDMIQRGMKSYIIGAALERNETVDRPEKDWLQDKGRATE
jgi:nucleotide sugar dehydrogenase